ncbi:hypothetical protein CEUSTIGMA_g5479.t1 [Chlamydomonas eustigma]|uniref:Adaptor protein ClpS core domain-containing protein n=1 Tax=Chlamydomonas eustigma TaxID=1157962 RepID=A0A250X4M2_9CHLO|nr:hypothetical protein CEUSTIGMA_g5479.t1 [Chlamydomonas eustigma]|eukprot:GAX78037.1 hypothetical protein CEUSTIGMA_g5479.t1 [Chlamydomonas eustigma]
MKPDLFRYKDALLKVIQQSARTCTCFALQILLQTYKHICKRIPKMPMIVCRGVRLSSATTSIASYGAVRRTSCTMNAQARFGGDRNGDASMLLQILRECALLPSYVGFDVNKTAGWDSGKDVSFTTTLPKLDSGEGGANRDRSNSAGGGGWRVLLLKHDKHDEKTVVKAITRVVPNSDENHAKNCFHTSKQLGLAIITTCLKEHAEHYRDQLYSYGCRTAIEPDASSS